MVSIACSCLLLVALCCLWTVACCLFQHGGVVCSWCLSFACGTFCGLRCVLLSVLSFAGSIVCCWCCCFSLVAFSVTGGGCCLVCPWLWGIVSNVCYMCLVLMDMNYDQTLWITILDVYKTELQHWSNVILFASLVHVELYKLTNLWKTHSFYNIKFFLNIEFITSIGFIFSSFWILGLTVF